MDCSMLGVVLLTASLVCCLADSGLHPEGRIFGGKNATIEELPYQLAVVSKDGFCGGAAISRIWAATSASCPRGSVMAALEVLSGCANITSDECSRHGVEEIIIHSGYDDTTLEHDIALLRVNIPFPSSVEPLSIPEAGPINASLAVLSGYGEISNDTAEGVGQLRRVEMTVLQCNVTARTSKLCAGDPAGNKAGCMGDVGSPLVAGSRWLVGILITSDDCDVAQPNEFTSIAAVSQWIRANVGL